jgi:surfeit locus 1 family protein
MTNMLQKLRAAGLIWPTLAMLAGVALLLSLGNWQWQRKAWKEGLIADQAARTKEGPRPLAEIVRPGVENSRQGQSYELQYRRVTITGTFEHQSERHLYAPLNAGPGWQVMTPMMADSPLDAGRKIWILIDRGFVPDHLKQPTTREPGQPSGEVTVTGRFMPAGIKGRFTPDNDIARNRWFWRDLHAMWGAANHGWSGYYIEADATAANPGGPTPEWPKPGMGDAIFNNLSNRHLEYALTWWALAATLMGVYGFFARSKWPKS